MTPEQNKNLDNVIDFQQKLKEKQAAQKATLEALETPKPKFWLRRLMAGSAIALAAVAGTKAVEAAPQVVAGAEHFIGDAGTQVAGLFHETNKADLTGTIKEVVPENGTIEELAVDADPSVDPRLIESALKDQGVTPENIQPGEVIDVPVTPKAAAAHEALANQNK